MPRRDQHSTTGSRRGRGPRLVRKTRRRAARSALVGAILIAAAVTVLVTRRSQSPVTPSCIVSTSGASYTLSPDQAQNAAIITAVASRLGLADHAVTIALATSLQESKLRNLTYGDLDSVGLFQQRPSQGWGTRAQLLDPSYAAAAFYAGLVKIPGWQSMAVTDAAQAVQHSAAPGAYAPWEGEARATAVALTGEAAAGLSCRFDRSAGTAPAPTALAQALTGEVGTNFLGAAVAPKTGWMVASWAVAHAYNYHLRSVSFAGMTWQPTSGKWSIDKTAPGAEVVAR